MDNVTSEPGTILNLKTGYDLPVYGLANDTFYYVHVPALHCIFGSLLCAVAVLILSFRHKHHNTFFSWTKSERFIVYLAICDGGFNVFHSADHLQYVIAKDHVRPKELCEFYGVALTEFITAQNLMVNIVAINAFIMMYFNKNLDFGKYDWRVLAWTFGLPFVGGMAAAVSGQLGPNGVFCHLDAIKGGISFISMTTVPLVIIFTANTVLYVLTWGKIKLHTSRMSRSLKNANIEEKSHCAARNMSMFVSAFFIQWWAAVVFSVWQLAEPRVPQPLMHVTTIFSNLGGCLNLGIYIIIRRRTISGRNRDMRQDTNQTNSKSSIMDCSSHAEELCNM
ncbi:uncharacterized protein LOC123562331 [Mercenaria mercenaria]|uniref:uncharacterized protein LOC123562331 n=1 Tax=Mercenaria mercenaria TaxID=6596 RepID=UPI00234E3EB1|nr:uncharacterized protein LOC123562331 [Mercenaria mercenaria]